MALNFNEKGLLVAYINGGRFNGKLLFIDSEKPRSKIRDMEKCVKLPEGEGKFEYIMDPKTRRFLYVCGPGGSGKSWFSATVTSNFHDILPHTPIYLFSKLLKDEAFSDLEQKGIVKRIIIDQRIVETPINILQDINASNGALFVFDDIDTFTDKNIKTALNNLKADILELGRHNKIFMIYCSHLINPKKEAAATQTILNEMTGLVFFPGSGSYKQVKYALEEYWGINKKDIDKLWFSEGDDTRWVFIHKPRPQYVLTESQCFMLSDKLKN